MPGEESLRRIEEHTERMKAEAEEYIKQQDLGAAAGTDTAASSSGSNDAPSIDDRESQKAAAGDKADAKSSVREPPAKKQRRHYVEDAD